MNPTRTIAWLTGLLTLTLALFAFILSFNALADLAAEHSISIPALFPLIVEAAVVIFSLNALHRSLSGENAKWQWALIIGASLLAGSFNILHASDDLVSKVMAAMPSLFLLLSFETFLGQVKLAVRRSSTIQSTAELEAELDAKQAELDKLVADKQAELETLVQDKQAELETLVQDKQAELDKLTKDGRRLNTTVERLKTQLGQLRQQIRQAESVQASGVEPPNEVEAQQNTVLTTKQRRGKLVDVLGSEGDIGAPAFADRFNVNRGTIYNDLKALKEAGIVGKNGGGWKVKA